MRAAVLGVLLHLMVDVTQPQRKEQLKRSGIGRAVLFLYKLPEETASNRRLAKQLVESWSRPIFDQYSEARHDDMRAEDERLQLRAARQQVCTLALLTMRLGSITILPAKCMLEYCRVSWNSCLALYGIMPSCLWLLLQAKV